MEGERARKSEGSNSQKFSVANGTAFSGIFGKEGSLARLNPKF